MENSFYIKNNDTPNLEIREEGKDVLRVSPEGEVFINDKPLETLEDHKKAIALIVKGICNAYR